MHNFLTKPLDWFSIQLARLSVHNCEGHMGHLAEAERLLCDKDFLCGFVETPRDVKFTSDRDFSFTSPIATSWVENNTVHGKLFRCADEWQSRPTVVLVHGWNAETGYRVLFPYLAWRLTRAGINTAMIELPYHCQRKPRGRGSVSNFLSDDLVHVVEAARQSIADTRATVGWLRAQGCREVGVWGISLGAWLTGLLVCADEQLRFAVLLTPISRIDRVIEELDFCKPIRRSLDGAAVPLDPLNLSSRRPKIPPERILIVESAHDLFAPVETIEELWLAWDKPEIWRTQHGHISVLMSAPIMERTVDWIAAKVTCQS